MMGFTSDELRRAIAKSRMTQCDFAERVGIPLPILRRAARHGSGSVPAVYADKITEYINGENRSV